MDTESQLFQWAKLGILRLVLPVIERIYHD